MAKRTFSAKEILTDIKTGMDDSALMEKYGLSEKGLQSLCKKFTDAGVLKQRLSNPCPAFEVHHTVIGPRYLRIQA